MNQTNALKKVQGFKTNKVNELLVGPPYLSGKPHIGHALNFICKDFYSRISKTNLVYNFDAQGLPIEKAVQKEGTDKSNTKKYVESCYNFSKTCLAQMVNDLNKLGLKSPISLENCLCTTDYQYKLKLFEFLKVLNEQGYVKQFFKHVDFCFNCNCTLANAELEDRLKNKKVYVFKAQLTEFKFFRTGYEKKPTFLLFCTTEPATYFLNKLLVINPDHKYQIYESAEQFIISGALKEKDLNPGLSLKDTLKGSNLVGQAYCLKLKNGQVINKNFLKQSPIVRSNQVNGSDVQGVIGSKNSYNKNSETPLLKDYAAVGLSPWFNEKDYYQSIRLGIPKEEIDTYSKEAIETRIKIEREGLYKNYAHENYEKCPTYRVLKYEKEYPTCWRCKERTGSALLDQIYLVLKKEERESLVKEILKITCVPSTVKEKFISWAQKDKDWVITRNRQYGTPFPFLVCKNPKCENKVLVPFDLPESIIEKTFFEAYIKQVISKSIDLKYFCKCGHKYSLVQGCLDVWADSGFLSNYHNKPYNLFMEGPDQVRGWYYSSFFLSYLKNKKAPCKKIYSLGWVMDKNTKISKSLGVDLFFLRNILTQVTLQDLRSFALTHANHKNVNYSLELVQREKKYTNVIKNTRLFLKQIESKIKLKQPLLNEAHKNYFKQSEILKLLKDELKALVNLKKRLIENLKSLNYSIFWISLKQYILLKFSRTIINKVKNSLTPRVYRILKTFWALLEKLIAPVLPFSF